jgi:hypothetical protein
VGERAAPDGWGGGGGDGIECGLGFGWRPGGRGEERTGDDDDGERVKEDERGRWRRRVTEDSRRRGRAVGGAEGRGEEGGGTR